MVSLEVIPTHFESNGETLRGNFVKPIGEGPFPGICKYHGLPGSADQVHGMAMSLAAAGFLVLTFDFRGFRASEGYFSLAGEIEDAHAAVTHLSDSEWMRNDWIGVYGASFGGAVAICSAARDDRISSICVRAPIYNTQQFTESSTSDFILHEIATTVPDEMHGAREDTKLFEMLIKLQSDASSYNPMKVVHKLAPREIFIITGDLDPLIDVEGVKRLYNQANEPKKLIIVEGADHNLSDNTSRIETERMVINWFEHQVKC